MRSVVVPRGGEHEARRIIEGNAYPWPLSDKPQRVVDLGAHVGEWTIMAAILWPEATIFGFEPHPDTFIALEENCRPYKNIKLFRAAVTTRGVGGYIKLHIDEMGTFCNSVFDRGRTVDTIEAEAISPKHIAGLNPDILKMDIEGDEPVVLAEIGRWLPLERINRIYVEFHEARDRIFLENILLTTHDLHYANIPSVKQGEVMYLRR